ncbi:NAD(P)H-dependent flavin oxidoreductase [Clostridium sp. ZS2-4]|uniref:NAD(P)H-dependent flavin oxidoreductase n=1 Tax=Clostridium sp. ZS2-4 TaxID=2987703 RepID=UPI00227BCDC5|nr:nitronate monooxygenase [Clostridium sp. ZS2-4]MCY6356786.1 nitronate monooxygenase [Clostridium sp. ZS2-4]
MNLPPLKIGELTAKLPIIQGGMGIGISLSSLASAVANAGGIGVISGVQIGYKEEDFETNTLNANIRALKKEIQKARKLSPNGILGVNIMVAATHYKELVLAAVKEKIDLIICGAGLPSDLPKLIKGSNTKIAPIVSSGKAASVITRMWKKKFDYVPDLIVVEGHKAGGHLGFSSEELENSTAKDLHSIVKEVLSVVKPLEEEYNKHIPIVAGGGVFNGNDIAELIKIGAAGVQMATRFVATEECDAHINFKKAYVNAGKEDVIIIKSPVGMPGRAINNEFIKSLNSNNSSITKCYSCIKHCDPAQTPYCISKALINAVNGNIDNALVFAGTNAYKIDKIVTVKELMDELVAEAEANL